MTNPPDQPRFGHLIRNRRKDLKHLQTDAANALGVKQQQISVWEAGTEKPGWKYAQPLADYFGIDLTEMLLLLHAEHTGRPNGDSVLPERIQSLEETVRNNTERINLHVDAAKKVDLKVDGLAESLNLLLQAVNDLRHTE